MPPPSCTKDAISLFCPSKSIVGISASRAVRSAARCSATRCSAARCPAALCSAASARPSARRCLLSSKAAACALTCWPPLELGGGDDGPPPSSESESDVEAGVWSRDLGLLEGLLAASLAAA